MKQGDKVKLINTPEFAAYYAIDSSVAGTVNRIYSTNPSIVEVTFPTVQTYEGLLRSQDEGILPLDYENPSKLDIPIGNVTFDIDVSNLVIIG